MYKSKETYVQTYRDNSHFDAVQAHIWVRPTWKEEAVRWKWWEIEGKRRGLERTKMEG